MNIENKNNNVGPPEQKSAPDFSVSSVPAVLKSPPSSTNPSIPSVGRPKRAKFKHRNHRRTGKVARLPSAIRHEICLMFTRYTEYKDIIAWLASHGHPNISESNLSRWRKGGFQDWLRREQQKKLDLIEFALDLLEGLAASEKEKLATDPHVVPPGTSRSDRGSGGPFPPTDNGPLTTDSTNSSPVPPVLGGGSESTLNN